MNLKNILVAFLTYQILQILWSKFAQHKKVICSKSHQIFSFGQYWQTFLPATIFLAVFKKIDKFKGKIAVSFLKKNHIFDDVANRYRDFPKNSIYDSSENMNKFSENLNKRPKLPENQWHLTSKEETAKFNKDYFDNIYELNDDDTVVHDAPQDEK